MKQIVRLMIPLIGLAFFAPTYADVEPTAAEFETQMALRDLWVEHVFWVRNYVVASANQNEPQREQSEREIIANAHALADSIVPFYGQEAGDSLFTLLGGHWGAIKKYDEAASQDSQRLREAAIEALTSNARAIAQFLSTANPYLPEDAVFSLLSVHGAHHVTQINEILSDNFAAEAQTWAAMRHHMLVLADTLTGGISKQFPDRFQPAA